jgi:hypothetical protein
MIVVKSTKTSRHYYTPQARSRYSEYAEGLPPHLYSISKTAFENLSSQPQTIAVQGPSGSGKTFNALHLTDHLLDLGGASADLKSRVHAAFQALHILGSKCNPSNIESTAATLVTEVWFNDAKTVAGVQFQGSLWGSIQPKEGRSYQVLHSLSCASKSILQGLHISHIREPLFHECSVDSDTLTRLKITDSETWQRYLQCLSTIGLHRQEVQGLLQVFAAVIVVLESSDSFTYQLSRDRQPHWLPHNRSTLQKLSKLLGTTQDRIQDYFAMAKDRSQAYDLAVHLADRLYTSAFKWLLALVNAELKPHFPESKISVLDFPGFTEACDLEGLVMNLASESCHYYCAQSLFKLTEQLKHQGYLLDLPTKSRPLVEFLVGDRGLLGALSTSKGSLQEFLRALQPFKASQALVDQDSLSLAYTWGTVRYDIKKLVAEARGGIDSSTSNSFLKGCLNRVLAWQFARVQTSVLATLKRSSLLEDVTAKLAEVLQHKAEPFVVYCLPPLSSRKDLESALMLVRNSLVNACLLWSWYGYIHWLKLEDFVVDLEQPGSSRRNLKSKLEATLNPGQFLLGRDYVLLSSAGYAQLLAANTKVSWINSDATELSFSVSESSLPRVSHPSPFFSSPETNLLHFDLSQFSQADGSYELVELKLEGIKPAPKAYVSYPPKLLSLAEDLKALYLDKVSLAENVIYVASPFDCRELTQIMQDYMNTDYSACLPAILKIQGLARGHFDRKHFKALRGLHRAARVIQSWWRRQHTSKQSRMWAKVVQAVCCIQRKWRLRAQTREAAAYRIQRWYLSCLTDRFLRQQRRRPAPSKRLQETMKRKALASDVGYSFSPKLSKTSQRLAIKHQIKVGLHLPLADRAQLQESQRQIKLHKQRQQKAEEESRALTYFPQTNAPSCANDFFKRQAQTLMRYKQHKEALLHTKAGEEQAELTFKPKIIISQSASKSPVRTVNDLHRWAEVKQNAVDRAREEKERAEGESQLRSSILKTSTVLVKNKRAREELQAEAKRLREQSRLPHWPK